MLKELGQWSAPFGKPDVQIEKMPERKLEEELDQWSDPAPFGILVPDVQIEGMNFGFAPKAAGNMVAITGFAENNFEGAVYIFETEDQGLTWSQAQRIEASDGTPGSAFGVALDIHEDLLFVGRNEFNFGLPGPGRVYVFRRDGGLWEEVSILHAEEGQTQVGAFFGVFIRRMGNYVIISAPLETNEGGASAGAAYLFRTDDGGFTWVQVSKITDPEPGDQRNFGSLMEVDGNHLIICSTDHDLIPGSTSFVGAGAAYIYTWPDLEYVVTLTASDGRDGDEFGFGLSILNGIACVGARRNNNQGFEEAGAIYVFSQAHNWTQVNKLVRADPKIKGYYGHNIWMRGNLMLVGGNELGVPNGDPGYVDVLSTPDGGFTWTNEVSIRTDVINDFGYLNYLNQDGVVFVAAPAAEVNGIGSGAVFMYRLDGSLLDNDGGSSSSKKSSGSNTTAVVLGVCIAFGALGFLVAALTCLKHRRANRNRRVPNHEDRKMDALRSTQLVATSKYNSASTQLVSFDDEKPHPNYPDC